MQRKTCHFSGRVQGVGFRYTAQSIARRFDVTGYVQNLLDGQVKLVAEGDPTEVDRFIEAVRHHMGGYIRDTRVETTPATGEFSGFTIEH